MTTVTIPLTDEQAAELRSRATETGLTPEEFLRQRVGQLLETPEVSFQSAADYVLKKNAELYRRLA